jgi:hypothetical protein
MPYEMRGSMLVYFTLFVTSGFTRSWRRTILVLAFGLSIYSDDFLCGAHFYAGVLLAELSISMPAPALSPFPAPRTFRLVKLYYPFLLGAVGLYLASCTFSGAGSVAWSRTLLHLGSHVFGTGISQNCLLR